MIPCRATVAERLGPLRDLHPKDSLTMHPSSLENMQRCYDRYIADWVKAEPTQTLHVLDVGGADVNGSYHDIFSAPCFNYTAADLSPGDGVQLVLEDPYRLPLADESVDIVLSGQMLEHSEFFWLAFKEMVRIMKPSGFVFLIAPSSGPIHRYPVDCYRFYPDAYAALARYAGCHLQEVWRDTRGPWQDLVGVFCGSPLPLPRPHPMPASLEGLMSSVAPPIEAASREAEAIAGTVPYLEVMEDIHAHLEPTQYLEIGIRNGRSLALADCPAIGIDPAPMITAQLGDHVQVIDSTSDDYFFARAGSTSDQILPDLVFIDGMHLFEFALRDFMNVERHASATTLAVIDDIYPNHPEQATRNRSTRVWMGDVWKLHLLLRETRPDLTLLPLDTQPSGLLLIAGLDPRNQVLWQRYNPLVRQYRDKLSERPPEHVLNRQDAVDPADSTLVRGICSRLRTLRSSRRVTPSEVGASLHKLLAEWDT